MTYQTEFTDFDPATMPAIPADWIDKSWHNDTMPSFTAPNGLEIWIDYADEGMRELQGGKRFAVQVVPDDRRDAIDVLVETDEWSEVMDTVNFWEKIS